jgi:hypothetical protein
VPRRARGHGPPPDRRRTRRVLTETWHVFDRDDRAPTGVSWTQPDREIILASSPQLSACFAGCPRWDSNPHSNPFKGRQFPTAIRPLTCVYTPAVIATAGTLAHIRHTGGRSGLRRSAVNPALTPARATGQSASPGVPTPLRLPRRCRTPRRVGRVKGAAGIAQSSRSDGEAALGAVGAAWTMIGRGSDVRCGGPCAGSARQAMRSAVTRPDSATARCSRGNAFRTGPALQEPTDLQITVNVAVTCGGATASTART